MVIPHIFREGSSIRLHCGVEYARLREWVDGTEFADVTVTLAPLEDRRIAQLRLPITEVLFEGPDEAVEAAYTEFMVRFMSAGG